MLSILFLTLLCVPLGFAKIVYKEWNITWVTAAPDGFSRPVIGINGEWPCPVLRATQGDTVIVTMNNQLGNQSTALHWHGIHQNGTTQMDGVPGVTQCPVAPGQSMTYEWLVSIVLVVLYTASNSTKGGSTRNLLVPLP